MKCIFCGACIWTPACRLPSVTEGSILPVDDTSANEIGAAAVKKMIMAAWHYFAWKSLVQKLIIFEQLTWVYGRVMLRMDGKSPQHCAWWRSLDHKNCLQVVSKWVRAFLAIVSDPLQKKLFNQHSSQKNTFVAPRTLCADTTGSPLYLQSQAEARIRIAKMTGDIRKWTCDWQIVPRHGVA